MGRYSGTAGNDTVTGFYWEADTFFDFGIGSDTLTGGTLNDTFSMSVDEKTDTISGGGGEDRIDYSHSDRGLTIDLSVGKIDAVFGDHSAVVARVTGIEDVTGSDFADTIRGNAGDNIIEGGGGADIIDGRDGNDTVSYAHSGAAVMVNLGQTVQYYADAGGDQLFSIENVTGSAYGDWLTGNNATNRLDGGNGSDHMFGGFDGQIDVLDGGAGIDWVDYSSANRSMTIVLDHDGVDGSATLDETTVSGTLMGKPYTFTVPAVQEDTLRNVENVIGTAGDDHITGNASNNRLEGGAGLDVIDGGAGSDVIIGGLGGDQLFGGNDTVRDTFVFRDYHDSMNHTTVVDHQYVQDGIDTIRDFRPGQDVIDLSGLESQVAGGAQLHWIDTNTDFTGHAGEIRVFDPSLIGGNLDSANNGTANELYINMYVDLDGDRSADFALTVVSPYSLTNPQHSDFIL
jgi:Ca2+-binding RTX toxin-like protein